MQAPEVNMTHNIQRACNFMQDMYGTALNLLMASSDAPYLGAQCSVLCAQKLLTPGFEVGSAARWCRVQGLLLLLVANPDLRLLQTLADDTRAVSARAAIAAWLR